VDQISDYNVSHAVAYGERPIPYTNDYHISDHHQRQKNLTQELRLQNTDASSRLQYVAGLYYEKKKQRSTQGVDSNFLMLRNPYYTAVNNGAPFGAGTSAFVNYYGMGGLTGYNGSEGSLVYHHNFYAVDTQQAIFAQADWEFVDRLKLTAGVRYSRNKTSFAAVYDGAENSATAPQGRACLPGTFLTGCVPVAIGQYKVGEGPFAPRFTNSTIKAKDTSVNPRLALEFQATPRDMVYASASRGFRPGAAQGIMGEGCSAQLAQLGFTDATGKGASPPTYDRDNVWSYEIGAKNRLFGRIRTAASAYLMKWKDIQAAVSVSSCNQAFVTNLGGATGKGFDFDMTADITDHLAVGVQVGYAIISFDEATKRGTSTVYTKGSSIPNAGPPWRLSLSGDYNLPLSDAVTAYAHADYAYTSKFRRTGNTDPGVTSYDRYIMPLPEAQIVNARVGARYSNVDLSFFAYNLFNSTDLINYSRTGIVYNAKTFQPRTFGLTASYRY
jgi:outer membrane receptor protein involved in Fe transport